MCIVGFLQLISTINIEIYDIFYHGSTTVVGQALLLSRFLEQTHSVGLLWKSDQPVAETPT
jgi:hypothetical protein